MKIIIDDDGIMHKVVSIEELQQIRQSIANISVKSYIGDSVNTYGARERDAESFRDEALSIIDKYMMQYRETL